jgi:NAD(P)-dependent dehydrogenase (short-subunit alcohol dehydrogenase family)
MTRSIQSWTPTDIPDQTGKTAYITGGNSGIGLETARNLVAHGARVILAGRSSHKLNEAAQALRREFPGAEIDTSVVDLANLTSIKDETARISASERIELLFDNAGVMNLPDRRETTDGFEMTFGTNHLGHFALTAGLMPALRRADAARIITVSAIAAKWKSGDLVDVMSEKNYGAMSSYAKSKRANVVFTVELARRLDGTNIAAVVVHPGAAETNLQRHTTGLVVRLAMPLVRRFLMGNEKGAAWPSLYVATADEIENGAFYAPAARDQTKGTPVRIDLPRDAGAPAVGAALWLQSEELTDVTFAPSDLDAMQEE